MGRGLAKKATTSKATASKVVVKRKRVAITDGSEEDIEETHTIKKARVVGGARKAAGKKGKGAKNEASGGMKVDAKTTRSSRKKKTVVNEDESESESDAAIVVDSDKEDEDLDDQDDEQGDGDEDADADGGENGAEEGEDDDGGEGDDEVRDRY